MAEPKRYVPDPGHFYGMREKITGDYVSHSDYTTLSRERDELRRAFERAEADVQALSREVERLRMVEAAANALFDRGIVSINRPGWMVDAQLRPIEWDALAEACGRKGR